MRPVAAVDVLILLWGLPREQLLCVLLVMVSLEFLVEVVVVELGLCWLALG